MRSTATASPPGAILYVDHARHLTPLTLCYHATASRHLTSGRTDVVPPSTAVEVDSAYCPRCLTFCDTASASLGVCQKDLDVDGGSRGGVSCKDCPVCFSPVSISIDAKNNDSKDEQHTQLVCHYLCGYCQWSSQECGVTSNADKLLEYATPSDAEIDIATEKDAEKQRQIIIAQLSRELEMCLQQKISERNNPCNELFRSITNTCVQREQEEERRSRMRMGAGTTSKGRVNSMGVSGGWSLESLEQSLLEKKKELDSPWIASEPAHTTSPEVEDDTTNAVSKEQHQHILSTSKQSSAQMVITTTTPRFRSDLLPLPVPFRARVSRRCLAELAVGKTGILIKPKLNPLEGDSSLRAGHGQWWKKDSSAVHVVPRVQLCRHVLDTTRQRCAALLKVRNPTLNMIRFCLSGPSSPINENDAPSPIINPLELENILIDPFQETFVQAHLCPSEATTALSPTEWLVLDHAEDPFLDIGKGQDKDPPEVMEWDASSALSSSSGDNASALRVVGTRRDTAWIELTMTLNSSESSEENLSKDGTAESKYLAVPIAMQIEVGNGSWEASLIKRRDLPAGNIDIVTLDLVALLS